MNKHDDEIQNKNNTMNSAHRAAAERGRYGETILFRHQELSGSFSGSSW